MEPTNYAIFIPFEPLKHPHSYIIAQNYVFVNTPSEPSFPVEKVLVFCFELTAPP